MLSDTTPETEKDGVDSPVHSSSRTSDLEVHWRPPTIRLHVPDSRSKIYFSGLTPVIPVDGKLLDTAGSKQHTFNASDELGEAKTTTGRTSMDVVLDQLEAANGTATRNRNQAEDSVLSSFDPLASRPENSTGIATNGLSHTERESVETNHHCLPNLTSDELVSPSEGARQINTQNYLISPFITEQNVQPNTESTPATPLSTGFTPITSSSRQVKVSSPFVFSPWMHRSVLEQALGGGDQSPEWTEPAEVDISQGHQSPMSSSVHKTIISEQVHLSDQSSMSVHNTTEVTDASQSYASAVAMSDAGDFDMLASLLERVNVCEDKSMSKPENSCEPPEDVCPSSHHTPDRILVTSVAPDTYNVHMKHNSPASQQQPTECSPQHRAPVETTPQTYSVPQSRRRTIDLNSASALAPVIDAIHTPNYSTSHQNTPHRSSARLSISSISDMVSMAARSLYGRIGGGSSSINKSPATPEIASPYPNQQLSPLQQSPPIKQTDSRDQSIGLPNGRHSNVATSDSLVHSVDEDVWESIGSIHEVHSSMAIDTSVRCVPGHSFQFSDENKENVHASQTDVSQPCHPLHQDRLCESVTDSTSLGSGMVTDSNSPRSITSSRSGLHETQITPHLTASGDGPEDFKALTKPCNPPVNQESSVSEKQLLRDEVLQLRAVADELKSVMNAYERTILDADALERERCTATSAKIMQIAAERDEAMEQAATMFKAYEDMYRRVQRAKETIEAKKEKQKVAVQYIERYANRFKTIEDKYGKLNEYYVAQLTEALIKLDRQKDELDRKLDKLQLELRQHELRNTTLKDEIRLKEQHSLELTEISNKFFH